MYGPMKFTNVEVRGGLITANVELEPKVDGVPEAALGRAVAEVMPSFTTRGNVRVIEDQSGISIVVEVAENDFERLQEVAAAEQQRLIELIREANRIWGMLCVVERARGYDRNGLPKPSDDEKREGAER